MKKIKILISTKAAAMMTTTAQIQQNENKQNPFGLVYDGAITENVKGKINIHLVTYRLNGIDIAANVYTPANYDTSKKYPAIVLAHPNGGIKEQTDFISQYAGVDVNRLGAFGICGGGGYTLKATQTDKRFNAVATLSMLNSGEIRRNGFQNSQLNTIQERLKKASDARMQEAAGGKIIYGGVASITDEEIAKTPSDLYREGYEYYYRTHAHPNSTFLYTLSSLQELMSWNAATDMDLLNQPLLMIAGSKADTKNMTDDAFAKATNAKNKELFLIDGATHIQTYWRPEYVSQAVNKLVSFYQTNL